MGSRDVDTFNVEAGAVPIDTTGAAVTGDYVSLKNYGRLVITVLQGAWAGGTPAVTLKQALTVAGGSKKALAFTKMWTKTGLTGTTFTKTAVTSNTFNLTATANSVTVMVVNVEDLDVDGGFDCVRVGVASPGSNADLIAAHYMLLDPRYPQNVMTDAKVD